MNQELMTLDFWQDTVIYLSLIHILNLVLRKIYYTPQEMLYIIVMEIRMKRLHVLMDVDVLDV